jgi:TetR/AcrR family transcriptional regulator
LRLVRLGRIDRRRQIIEAVGNIVAVKGRDGVTIDAIAEEVGVTEGAIYRHFKNKEQIILGLIEDVERALLAEVNSSIHEDSSALDNLGRILTTLLDSSDETAVQRRIVSFTIIADALGEDALPIKVRVFELLSNYLQAIRGVLEQGINEGIVRPDLDLEAVANTFLGLVQSTITLWALSERQFSLEARGAQVWDLCLRGISTEV